MQTSLLAPTTIAVLHKQELGITTYYYNTSLNAQKMYCLLEIKTVAAICQKKSTLYALQVLSKAFWYDQNTEWNPTTVVLEFLGAGLH